MKDFVVRNLEPSPVVNSPVVVSETMGTDEQPGEVDHAGGISLRSGLPSVDTSFLTLTTTITTPITLAVTTASICTYTTMCTANLSNTANKYCNTVSISDCRAGTYSPVA